jgi:hypothetical protein
MNRKAKIIIAFQSLIIVLLLIGILTSFTERIVYYFNDRIDDRHSTTIYSGCYSDTIETFSINNTACVEFIKKKSHESENSRTEYVFKVIEWLNSDKTTAEMYPVNTYISIYSKAYPLKWISEMEIFEMDTGFEFEKGTRYIITFWYSNYGESFASRNFINLDKLQNSPEYSRRKSQFESLYGITADMTADEIVARLKELIAEEKAKK